MKRFLTLIAAATALELAAFAYAGPEDQAGAAQPSPAEQPSMPSIDPATPGVAPTDPSATAQSSVSASQSTRLAALCALGHVGAGSLRGIQDCRGMCGDPARLAESEHSLRGPEVESDRRDQARCGNSPAEARCQRQGRGP